MTGREEVEYTVLLVFPGYGTERENAETIVEAALEWLNTYKDEPGFRFHPLVSAHVEIVPDADEARERIEADPGVAMVLVHDMEDEERDALLRFCQKRNASACITVDAPRPRGRPTEPMKVVFRKQPPNRPSAHEICAETLTGEVEEDEDTEARVGEVIAVLALGVMQHYWQKVHP
jgi:hypothetical protein